MPKTTVLPPRPAKPARLPPTAMTAIILILGAVLGACASTQSPANPTLSGHWRLDTAASDNVGAKIAPALDRARARLRRRRRGKGNGIGGNDNSGDDSATSVDQFGNITGIGPDFTQLRQRLLDALDVPANLVLDVRPDLIVIQSDGLPARDYSPGEKFTRVDDYGTAVLDSHWSGNAFVLVERYTSGARLTERYEIDHDGSLDCTRSLADPTIGKLDIRSVYRRNP
jgi:hypothetical protein